MKVLLSLTFLLVYGFYFSQAIISFDTLKFDLGYITENSNNLKKEIYFKNTGNEPLIISRASTGDGGSYATYDKEPVLPGKKGKITFVYDTKRIGVFNRSISIESNSKNRETLVVKGEVVRKRTSILVSKKEFDLGEIPFDSIAKFECFVSNSGKEKLYFNFDSYHNYDVDLLSLNVSPVKDSVKNFVYDNYTQGMDSLRIQGQIINLFGNTGDFQRELVFIYNSHDTLKIIVKGKYTGNNAESHLDKSFYDKGFQQYRYEDGKLKKIELYNSNTSLKQEYYFENSYCHKIIFYHWKNGKIEKELLFKKGKLIEEKRHQVGY